MGTKYERDFSRGFAYRTIHGNGRDHLIEQHEELYELSQQLMNYPPEVDSHDQSTEKIRERIKRIEATPSRRDFAAVFQTCRACYDEALPIFYAINLFIVDEELAQSPEWIRMFREGGQIKPVQHLNIRQQYIMDQEVDESPVLRLLRKRALNLRTLEM